MISSSIDFGSKIVHKKVINAVLLGNNNTFDVLFFATVLNKYMGLCLFSSLARVCSLYHGVGLFSLIFLKRKGATVSKMLDKRESIVSVTSSSFSALLDVLRNLDKSGKLLTKQSFEVEVMVLPYL